MTFLFIGALLALIAAQQFMHGRQVKAERAHHSQRERRLHSDLRDALDHARELQNQIVLLKVKPEQAAVVALGDSTEEPGYISPFDDDALAEYEAERSKVTVE